MLARKTDQIQTRQFAKTAFLESAKTSKERLEYEIVLKDGETYTLEQAQVLVEEWKNTKLNRKKEVK
ncbi:MAG TPA: hypothetical protein VNQ57_10690 [Ureibacillus sp.]|nr:hypothetical protein [Ureibacillus sp.]